MIYRLATFIQISDLHFGDIHPRTGEIVYDRGVASALSANQDGRTVRGRPIDVFRNRGAGGHFLFVDARSGKHGRGDSDSELPPIRHSAFPGALSHPR